jgi:hypothetical protein
MLSFFKNSFFLKRNTAKFTKESAVVQWLPAAAAALTHSNVKVGI